LICPECKTELELKILEQTAGEIITGNLHCPACQHNYPIVRGIPRFVPHQLEPTVLNTVEGFGYQWQTFNEVARNGHMGSTELFLDFIKPVTTEHFYQKLILDAGCGTGRFCKTVADFGADQVIGVDLSDSVEVAYQGLKHYPNIHIVQADLFKLPLKPAFDYVFSVGVLHHTLDPRKSFRAITQLLKPKGSISVWVYSQENNGWVIRVINPLRTYLTSRLPRKTLYLLSLPIAIFLHFVLAGIYRPINLYPKLSWIRRRLFYNDYLFFLSKFSFQEQLNVVYDHLVPGLAFYISKGELESWFEENHLEHVSFNTRLGNAWCGFGVRKARND
jgi:SAM-dependent methyltransferase